MVLEELIERLEDLPSHEKLDMDFRSHRSPSFKHAHRWLFSQRGRHVDDVFSEWCKLPWLDPKHRCNRGFGRQVFTEVVIEDGIVMAKVRGEFVPLTSSGRHPTLYVHPKTRRISVAPLQKLERFSWSKMRELNVLIGEDLILLGDYHQLLKENGIWFEYVFHPTREVHKKTQSRMESVDSNTFHLGGEWVITTENCPKREKWGSSAYGWLNADRWVKSKRQLNRKELRAHNIKNF